MDIKALSENVKQNAALTGEAIEKFLGSNADALIALAQRTVDALAKGNKVLVCGNGGSAADAQHMAAEFVGRFLLERRALPAMALTVDTSALTAIGNDYGYEQVFARQVEAFAKEGDIVIGISTSGSSKNVCLALEKARELGAYTVGLSGEKGGPVAELSDEAYCAPTGYTPRVQECHISLIHCFCDLAEQLWVAQQEKA